MIDRLYDKTNKRNREEFAFYVAFVFELII